MPAEDQHLSDRNKTDGLPANPEANALLPEPEGSLVTSAPGDDESTVGPTWSVSEGPPPPIGPRVGTMGRYTLLDELGSGGMGVVYKAWDPALDRAVALKVLLAGRLASRRHLSRFLDEARAIARLDHPALVEVYDIGTVDDCPYFTMEFVAGRDLEQVIARESLDPMRACRLLARIARGLAVAHAAGIVHRDIKPANILVDDDDNPRLIDFGIARFLESGGERTRTGQVVGTPAYMAPEQAMGDTAAIGPATDVFGLGATLYRLVAGHPPRRRDPAAPSTLSDGPRDVMAICHTAMAHAPGERYPSVHALADELERFVRGEPVQAALPGAWRRFRWQLRRARGAFVGAAVAAVLAGASWLAVHAWEEHRARQAQARRESAAVLRLGEAFAEGRRLRWADDAEEARRIEREVTLRRDVQDTRALARYHLRRAADAVERGDRVGARSATSSAYAAARHPDETLAAMIALGRTFADERRAEALRTIVDSLERRFPEARSRYAPLLLDAAMSELRFDDAAALARRSDDIRAPVLAALSRAVVTSWTPEALRRSYHWSASTADIVGDERPELVVAGRVLSTADARLPAVDVPIPPHARLYPLARGLAALERRGPPKTCHLMALVDGEWQPIADLQGTIRWVMTDFDGDGRPIVYASGTWSLEAWAPDAGGEWTRSIPHPPTQATQLYDRTLLTGHFGDRGPAIVLGSGGWRTYDLRVYTPMPDGGLRLAARRKMGQIIAGTLIERPGDTPLIAIGVNEMPAEPRLFPTDAPSGLPPGVHIVEWAADGLEPRAHLPIEASLGQGFTMMAGDLDGDGTAELVVSLTAPARLTLVYCQTAEGWSAPIHLPGVQAIALAQLDDDPAMELTGFDWPDGPIWSIGVGDDPIPTRPVPPLPPVDDRLDPDPIHDLARLGLVDEAIDGWRTRMRMGRDTHDAAWHAARLAEAADRPAEAARLYRRAAEGPRAVDALRGAVRTARAALDWGGERETLDRLVARVDATDAERTRRDVLARRLDARLAIDLGRALDRRWQIVVPDRLRVDRGRSALEILADQVGPIARLPLARTEGPFSVEMVFDSPRLEYGSGVSLRLRAQGPEGPARTLFGLDDLGWGGGSIVFQRVYTTWPGMPQHVHVNRQITTPAGEPIHVRVELDPETRRLAVIDRLSGLILHDVLEPEHMPAADERLYFEIASSEDDRRNGRNARIMLRRLELDGLRIADRPPPVETAPMHAAARDLANGEPRSALDAVAGRTDAVSEAIKTAALYDLGRWREADDTLRAWLDDAPEGGPIDRLARGRVIRDPLHFAPLVRASLGPAADSFLYRIYSAAFDKHPNDPAVQVAARSALLGAGDDITEPEHRLALLIARAAAHRSAGRFGSARADIDACRAVLESLPPPTDVAAQQARGARWAEIYRLQAEGEATAGDFDRAAEAIRSMLAVAPAPELMADALIASPALDPLHDHPVWATVRRAATWSDPSPGR